MKQTTSIQSKLDELIVKKSEDSLLNHLKTILLIREGYFIGNKSESCYKIWKYSFFWSGPFYPVIQININNDKVSVNTKMNIVGKSLWILLFSFVTYVLIRHGVLSLCFNSGCIAISLIGLLLLFCFLAPWILIYRFNRRKIIDEHNKKLL